MIVQLYNITTQLSFFYEMMNVTSNGYYTTQYLNQQQRQQRQRFQYAHKDNYQTPRTPHENLQGFETDDRAPIMRNVRPKRDPPTSLHSNDSPKASSANPSKPIIEAEVAPEDQLGSEPTPAELKKIHDNNILVTPIERTKSLQENQKRKLPSRENKNNDYYLKQKQRYDEAEEVKPKLYTHKTFREVFINKEEPQHKYNPIDTVFEQSDDVAGTKGTNAKLATFLKSIKVVKSDYNDYNYYDHRRRKSGRDVFVNEVSDDDDDDDDAEEAASLQEASQVGDRGSTPKRRSKKKKTLKTIWKNKVNRAKKELGRDFDSHISGNREQDVLAEISSSSSENIPESNQKGNDTVAKTGNEFAITSMVSLSFSYLWSWYDFYHNKSPSDQSVPGQSRDKAMVPATTLFSTHINDNVGTQSPHKLKGQKRARFANGSRQLFTNWNQPAKHMFQSDTTARRNTHRVIYPKKSDTSSLISSSPSEFIVEYDSSDEDSITQELYYNPQTKQLEAQPPTSFQSMITTSKSSSSNSSTSDFTNDSISPLNTVSNLLDLIKQIHIMQLIYTPIDFIGGYFPQLQTLIIVLELILFVWILYEVSRLVDALCMMVRAFCSPMIAVGRFMNKIM